MKVHRPGQHAVEFFFDAKHPVSVRSARRSAFALASRITEVAQLESDAVAAQNKATPQIVDFTPVRVWTHGVQGLGDLHCVGGCDICAHPMRLRSAEDVGEESDEKPKV